MMGSFPPNYEQRVADANQSGKIFRMSESYGAPVVRKALVKRGYIEQKTVPYNSVYFNINCAMKTDRITDKDQKEYEQVVIYRVIGKQLPHFVWVARQQHYHLYTSATLLNRIHITGLNFTMKDDLLCYINAIHNTQKPFSLEGLKFTRSYDWHHDHVVEEEFKHDYRISCAIGLIKFLATQTDTDACFIDPRKAKSVETISVKAIDLTIHVLLFHIKALEGLAHCKNFDYECELSLLQWCFICRAHRLISTRATRFRASSSTVERYMARIRYMAEVIPDYWPERMLDGDRSIYLLKPVTSGNGLGILLLNNDRKIMSLATNKKRKYIVQKYIEKPLLIYSTKFDIRQYFLVTMNGNKFSAWSHEAFTIKFATEEFTVDRLDESIHITNVTIQKRYRKRTKNPKLPLHNAWNRSDFTEYLSEHHPNHPNLFENVIYPAIKKCLAWIAELSFSQVEHRNGRFELFGCDWLICEDYSVCLLEINRSPSLELYTDKHEQVVGEVLDDLVKVVIDYPRSERTSSTGRFELLYEKDFV